MNWVAVGAGAAIGAWLRWGLGVLMNHIHAHLPLGTLLANLLGGYLIGLSVAFFNHSTVLSPEWRLFVITGFLGGLTTFSTFSAESVMLLQRGEYLWMLGHSLLHLLGSILFCIAGFACFRLFASS
jgi:crcB protein